MARAVGGRHAPARLADRPVEHGAGAALAARQTVGGRQQARPGRPDPGQRLARRRARRLALGPLHAVSTLASYIEHAHTLMETVSEEHSRRASQGS